MPMEIGRVACEGNPEEGDKRERGKCERKEKLILDMRFFAISRPSPFCAVAAVPP